MNNLKNLFSLISTAIFGVITVMEILVKKSGFASPSFIIGVLMLIMSLACRFLIVTKYNESNKNTMENAANTLKTISLPFGFLGGLTFPLSAIFTICTILTMASKFVTLPEILLSIVNAITYIVIILLPLAFAMGLLNGKYGKGTDFMLYTIGLMIYIAIRYFFEGAINTFVCSQLILSLSLWDMTSGLMRKEAPTEKVPKAPKPKKEKKSKKEEVKTEEVLETPSESDGNKD